MVVWWLCVSQVIALPMQCGSDNNQIHASQGKGTPTEYTHSPKLVQCSTYVVQHYTGHCLVCTWSDLVAEVQVVGGQLLHQGTVRDGLSHAIYGSTSACLLLRILHHFSHAVLHVFHKPLSHSILL